MSKYLRQAKTGRIYQWTAALAARPDMEECAVPETGGAPVNTASAADTGGLGLLNNLATPRAESIGEGLAESDKEKEKTATPPTTENSSENETGKTALKELKDYTEAELRELKHTELKTLLAGKFTGSPTKDALIALALEG
jgi:hypothetical protein